MANLRETDQMEHEIFDVVRDAEESILRAGRAWAKAVDDALPVKLPVFHQVVKGAFDFSEQVLAAQREFAQVMLKATRPVTKSAHSASAPPARRAA
ncbi:MAG TPA: hypothetical protein VK386_02760 [Acidimicrobiales bacterium]|nr:hypothetical protein [Acidimicrobiales bacterium]